MTDDDVDPCGCRWERQPGYGDVIVEPCDEHKTKPFTISLVDLAMVARALVKGSISEDEAEEKRGEICTRHGPDSVRMLDKYYEAQIERARSGQERL